MAIRGLAAPNTSNVHDCDVGMDLWTLTCLKLVKSKDPLQNRNHPINEFWEETLGFFGLDLQTVEHFVQRRRASNQVNMPHLALAVDGPHLLGTSW